MIRAKLAICGGTPFFKRPLTIVRPTFPPVDSFLEPFRSALESGQVTNGGKWVLEFERQLQDHTGVPTLAFCNGQTALMAMLRAAGVQGGEVIVPSFTFAATPHAIRWCGAEPIFADIASDGSMCLDPNDVAKKVNSRTVAILGVDAYGIPSNYRALDQIGQGRGLKVLYDSAPSFGARVGGRLVGGFGDAQIFSFHATKALATMEGGCLCSHDGNLLDRAKAIRNFGQTADGDCLEAGLNGKMSEICALIGLEQLKTFETGAARRRQVAQRIGSGLQQIKGLKVAQSRPDDDPIWLYLPVVIEKKVFGLDRDELAAVFAKENLYVRKYYSPACHLMSCYKGSVPVQLPETEAAARNVLALPVYNDMTDAEADGIIELFKEVNRQAEQLTDLLNVQQEA